jgi:acetyl-CoA acyltransferase 1
MVKIFPRIAGSNKVHFRILPCPAVGNVRNVDNHYDIRAAALAAGVPNTAPTHVLNRFCASGLQSLRTIANQIQVGEIECGMALGVESMTNHPKRDFNFSEVIRNSHQEAADCIMPMGWTSENVAKEFKITRAQMDTVAARSHSRAFKAQKSGKFAEEIFPVTVPDGNGGWKVVEHDDGIREGSTVEGLGKIKPAFPQWEPAQTTGGNAR